MKVCRFVCLAFLLGALGACTPGEVTPAAGGNQGQAGGSNAAGGGAATSADAGRINLSLPDGGKSDACIRATAATACKTPGGTYCGLIGDGCDEQIDCGNNCPTGWTCDATSHVCVGGADCKPAYQCAFTAGNTSGSYCGSISDGCGPALDCGDTCSTQKSGWLCENNTCVGGAGVCAPASCDPVAGARYCGKVGDGCGRSLDCGDKCSSLKVGWVCDTATSSCKGGTDCKKLACDGGPGVRYCGKVGDGCGGTVDCGDTCSTLRAGWVCDGSEGLCAGGPSCVKTACTVVGGGQYCGDIGDGCGGTLHCGDCPGSGTCTNNVCPVLSCGALCAAQVKCSSGTSSLTGTVYDPAGKVPIYNIIVYVPDAALANLTTGASCDSCSASVSGKPIATALSDASGNFKLDNVPVGVDFPLVMQVGKWRRQITINASEVSPCASKAIADPISGQARRLRLPRNQSEGNLPKIAITAGDADRLQCLFTRIGVDTAEFTNPDGKGAINIYNDNYDLDGKASYDSGTVWPSAFPLWASLPSMMKYDMVLMACGASQSRYNGNKKPADGTDPSASGNVLTDAMKLNMVKYLDQGGRAFAEHYHVGWLEAYPPLKDVVKYPCVTDGTANPCSIAPDGHAPFGDVATWADDSSDDLGSNITATIDQTFPKGQAFASWMQAVGGTSTLGTIGLGSDVKATAISTIQPPAQKWISQPGYVHYLTFNAPTTAPPAAQCGRFVFTGLHVAATAVAKADADVKDATFPTGCKMARDLSAPEKALEFMIFDLSSCLIPDSGLPTPPPVGGTSAPPTPPTAGGVPPPPPPPPPPPAPPPPTKIQ
jgi:hypothetical protein